MENRNAIPSIAKPSISKDDFEVIRRPEVDETPDTTELAALRDACRRTRLGRSMIAESIISKD